MVAVILIGGGGVTVTGLAAVERALRYAHKAAVDLRPVFAGPIRNSIHDFFRRRFRTHGSHGGERWAPLRAATVRIKSQSHRGKMGVLRRYNRLWASLVKRGAPEGVVNITKRSLEVGTSVPSAEQHQKGWTQTRVFGRPRKSSLRIAPRKLVPRELPTSLTREWESVIVEHVDDAIARGLGKL